LGEELTHEFPHELGEELGEELGDELPHELGGAYPLDCTNSGMSRRIIGLQRKMAQNRLYLEV
jgi:hypothetical protein